MRTPPAMPDATVTVDDLRRKYALLLALREGAQPGARAVLRSLAEEFPGALRELDALPLDALRARHDALADAPLPPWVPWIAAYHGLMRLTLALKRALPKRSDPDDARVAALADAATARWGATLDVAFVRAVHHPPRGRLGPLAFARLGERFGVAHEEIWQALFPTARVDRFEPRGGR
ncbi:MAG: hypothetical protein U0325_15400 [Polyangiales bacterium]